ncbi:MAG TPA: RNase adapter RapZ [Candidatus Limiplasma sp.]|nr:RNase adapter RapZ [Candidatus Limiplasma sp.]
MRFLIVTGLSGSGKTVALRTLEDLGALCVDNLPPTMLVRFMEACNQSLQARPMAAIGVDVRSGEFFDPEAVVKVIREAKNLGYSIDILFIDAADETLVNRYKETRRDHPLCVDGRSLEDAITLERGLLQPLKEFADHLIDSSVMNAKTLQRMMRRIVNASDDGAQLHIEVMSFGFKRGIPRAGDLVFDVRFLPNPFYIKELGHFTGLDEPVANFVLKHPVTQEFLVKCMDMLTFLLPNYVAEGKHRLVIAVGCTGGAHRSVAIAETIGAKLRKAGWRVSITHRDLEIEQALWTSNAKQ